MPTLRLDGAGPVFIRPPCAQDWGAWANLRAASRAFLTPWEPAWPQDALSRAAFLRRLKRQATEWRDDEAYSFLVFERLTGTMVGGLGLSHVRRGVAQTATIGYWVGAPFARQGFTLAATRLCLDFAFGNLNLHRVEASCLPTNEPSRRLMEKLGFHYEGYARQYLRIAGEWRDHLLYAILKESWEASRAAEEL